MLIRYIRKFLKINTEINNEILLEYLWLRVAISEK